MKYTGTLFSILLFLMLFFFLQFTCEYHFYTQEQNQLFQHSMLYISSKAGLPGGMALVTAEYLVQYFYIPYMGALITALLLTLAGLFTRGIVRKIAPETDFILLYVLIPVCLLFMHFNFNYQVSGTVAFLFMLFFYWVILCIPDKRIQLYASLVGIPLLFWLGGPIAFLFITGMFLYFLLYRVKPLFLIISYSVITTLLILGSTYMAWVGDYRFMMLPDFYYHHKLHAGTVIYFSWGAFLLIILFSFLFSERRRVSLKRFGVELIPQLIILIGLLVWGLPRYMDAKSYKMKELDYYARTGQWDDILQQNQGPLTNYLYIVLTNRALAEKGELAEKLFDYDQKGVQGLILLPNRTFMVSVILSDIYYTMGDIASAQQMAFEANLTTLGEGSPRLVKRLVETNLIFGAYPVAEKYISILERTKGYKGWANEHRRFLYNDEEIDNDPVLGQKRRGLTAIDYVMPFADIDVNIQYLIQPADINKNPIEYLGCLYLLGKDMRRFQSLVETYYGTDVLPVLPRSFQEAVITLSENNPDYWQRFNIPAQRLEHFSNYKKQILANKNNGNALPSLLRNSFGNTYWYYFMFK